MTRTPIEPEDIQPGDLIEWSGYDSISQTDIQLMRYVADDWMRRVNAPGGQYWRVEQEKKMTKYIDLAEFIGEGAEYSNTTSFCLGIECALSWLDEHPDQVPERTITRSKMRERMNENFTTKVRSIDVEAYTESLGRIVVPDPEPTNAEKLKAVLDAIGDSTAGYREHLASKLDEAGVKAPGGDDEH